MRVLNVFPCRVDIRRVVGTFFFKWALVDVSPGAFLLKSLQFLDALKGSWWVSDFPSQNGILQKKPQGIEKSSHRKSSIQNGISRILMNRLRFDQFLMSS